MSKKLETTQISIEKFFAAIKKNKIYLEALTRKELSCYLVGKTNRRTIIPFREKNSFIHTYGGGGRQTDIRQIDVYRKSLVVYTLNC